jgi:hypothetical protein
MSKTEINQVESAKMDNIQLEATLNKKQECKDDALKTEKGSSWVLPGCPISIFSIPCLIVPCCVSFMFI